jgi:hypothetical protein
MPAEVPTNLEARDERVGGHEEAGPDPLHTQIALLNRLRQRPLFSAPAALTSDAAGWAMEAASWLSNAVRADYDTRRIWKGGRPSWT